MNWKEVLDLLEKGEIRAAQKVDGKWQANTTVKEAILAAFKDGTNIDMGDSNYKGLLINTISLPKLLHQIEKLDLFLADQV